MFKNHYEIYLLFIIFKIFECSLENSIILTIIGPGENIDILGSKCDNNILPDELYINDVSIAPTKQINLDKEGENIIKIKWNNKLTHSQGLFCHCTSLISIDLLNFDPSELDYLSIQYTFWVVLL